MRDITIELNEQETALGLITASDAFLSCEEEGWSQQIKGMQVLEGSTWQDWAADLVMSTNGLSR